MDYPADRLEIQILDDSTDETVEIGRSLAREYQSKGLDVVHLHRTDRTGYKAGALEEGLKVAKGEFVAVFDADFVPPADFLRKTIHPFSDDKVGMVQVRWGHLNRDYSWLTKAQGVLLDGHFVVEHTARFHSGRFFNFNGTAGMWRRSCIHEAGGWQHDTITEDLDLSYRAQLAGWQFVFLPDVVAPAELPVEMNAFRTQQHRWTKGSIETARKLLSRVMKSSLPSSVKTEAFFHLTANIAYIMIVLLAFLMPMAIYVRVKHGFYYALLADIPFLLAGTVSLIVYYACSQKEISKHWFRESLLVIPFALTVGVGISLNNCKAVLEALWGHKTGFTRTPKYNVQSKKDSWKSKLYKGHKTLLPWIEFAFAVYFSVAVGIAVYNKVFSSLPFLVMFQMGFLYVSLSSLLQRR
jgi:cellulose synthase/poly-beta-1,6-N-acetylglucosamine synthase-like glycosyltransferase